MNTTQRVDVERLSELLSVMASSDPNRMTEFPGGCDCYECGNIFIGGAGHDYCAQCEAKRQMLAMLPEALPALLQQLAAQAAEIERLKSEMGLLSLQVPSMELQATRSDVSFYRGALEACKANRAEIIARAESAERDKDEFREELASLQVIHNCLRRDHERSKAQAKAAREIAEQWNADARAEGFGGGSVKGREIIEAMEAAFLVANGRDGQK